MFGLPPMAGCAISVLAFALVVMTMVHCHKRLSHIRLLCALLTMLLVGIAVWQMVEVARTSLNLHLSSGYLIAIKVAILIVYALVTCVFLIGAALTLSNDINFSNGQLVIRQSSMIYKLLREVPFLHLQSNTSLCKLSWIGASLVMVVVLIGPVVALLGLCVHCVLALIELFAKAYREGKSRTVDLFNKVFKYDPENPRRSRYMNIVDDLICCLVVTWLCGIAIGVVYWIWVGVQRYGWQIWVGVQLVIPWLVAVLLILASISYLSLWYLEWLDIAGVKGSDGGLLIHHQIWNKKRLLWVPDGVGNSVTPWNSMPNTIWVIWMIAKGNLCPKIVFSSNNQPAAPEAR